MFNRPTLQPLAYRLRLPHCGGKYIRETGQSNHQIIATASQAAALRMTEEQALKTAQALHDITGQVIRLEPVDPGQARGAA